MINLEWIFIKVYGYNEELEKNINEKEGFIGVYKYWKKFELEHFKNILSNLEVPSVVDFGAGQSVYEDEKMLQEAQEYMANFKNIYLILPNENIEKSSDILFERGKKRGDSKYLNHHFLEDVSNYTLASNIVYTGKSKPSKCADELIKHYKNEKRGIISSKQVIIQKNEQRKLSFEKDKTLTEELKEQCNSDIKENLNSEIIENNMIEEKDKDLIL